MPLDTQQARRLYQIVSDGLRTVSPWVVQIVLLIIMVSSFFPTVRQLFFDNQPLTVATVSGLAFLAFRTLLSAITHVPEELTPTARAVPIDRLGAELTGFASQKELKIDIFAYSTETFRSPLVALLMAIETAANPTRKIAVRVLMKDWDTIRFPMKRNVRPGDKEVIDTYVAETMTRNRRFAEEFEGSLKSRQSILAKRGCRMTYEIRLYPFDPSHKGIIINDSVGFHCRYGISGGIKAAQPAIWDWQGKDVDLMEVRANRPESEAKLLNSLAAWFEEVWDNFGVEISSKRAPAAPAA